jgi:hypothetical protein
MCMDHSKTCSCGCNSASFMFKDDIMPGELVEALYCPACSRNVSYNPETMLRDNGWIIEFDMEVARLAGSSIRGGEISPSYLFDEGYCTWRGIYPSDHSDSVRERGKLLELARISPQRYLEEFKKWGIERMERLAAEGWRKASTA